MNVKTIVLSVVVLLALIVGLSSVYIVNEREQAIIVQFGKPKRTVRNPGLHVKMPLLEQVIFIDKRTLSLDVPPQEVLASDQARILVDSFARYRIIDPLKRYQAASSDARAASLLEQILQSTVRDVLASQPMPEIVSGQRASVMQQIEEITNQQAATIGIEVVDVRLKRVDLPAQNSNAIFRRMETERQQEAAEKRAVGQRDAVKITSDADRQRATLVAEAERKSQVIRGEADARAVKVFAEAFGKDEEFFEFYRTMQAYKASLGKSDTRLILSPDSEFFELFVNSSKSKNR